MASPIISVMRQLSSDWEAIVPDDGLRYVEASGREVMDGASADRRFAWGPPNRVDAIMSTGDADLVEYELTVVLRLSGAGRTPVELAHAAGNEANVLQASAYARAEWPAGVQHVDPSGSSIEYERGEDALLTLSFAAVVVETADYVISDPLAPHYTVVAEPRGHRSRDESALSWSDATRTLTISPTGLSFRVGSGGAAYDLGELPVQIDDVHGEHWVFVDASGALVSESSPTGARIVQIISTLAPVAVVYWDAVSGAAALVGDERHGQGLDPETHLALHRTVGARLSRTQPGGRQAAITNSVGGATNQDASCQFEIDPCVLVDEDIQNGDTTQVLSPTAELPVLYRSGAGGLWRISPPTTFPLAYRGQLMSAGQRVGYNTESGGSWSLSEAGQNQYVCAHIVATNDIRWRYSAVVGQYVYSSVANARIGARREVFRLGLDGLPTPEMKFVGTLLAQTNNSWGNAPSARWTALDNGDNYVDLRREAD